MPALWGRSGYPYAPAEGDSYWQVSPICFPSLSFLHLIPYFLFLAFLKFVFSTHTQLNQLWTLPLNTNLKLWSPIITSVSIISIFYIICQVLILVYAAYELVKRGGVNFKSWHPGLLNPPVPTSGISLFLGRLYPVNNARKGAAEFRWKVYPDHL